MADTITLEGIRYVVAAAKAGSFSKAAVAMGVRQPTLSAAVKNCESTLGIELFSRSAQGVVLTTLGANVILKFESALAALDDAQALVSATRSANQAVILRLGVSPLIDSAILSRFVSLVAKNAANPQLVVKEANMDALVKDLSDGNLDLIFIPAVGAAQKFRNQLIGSEPVVLLSPSPLADRPDKIPVESLPNEEIIMVDPGCGLATYTKNLLTEFACPQKQYAGQAMSYRILQEWVNLGFGQALLPLSKVEDGSNFTYLKDGQADLEIFYEAAWNPQSQLAGLIAELVTSIEEA